MEGSADEEKKDRRRRRRRLLESSSRRRRRRIDEKTNGNDSVAVAVAVAPPEDKSEGAGWDIDKPRAIDDAVAAADVVEEEREAGEKERPKANNSSEKRLDEQLDRHVLSKDGLDPLLKIGVGGGGENDGLRIELPPSPPLPSSFSSDDNSWTRHHGASLSLLLILHVLFFYHWNKRKTLRESSTSYREIVRGKRFHRIPIALLSHPPAPESSSSSSSSSSFRGGSFRSSDGSSGAAEGGGGGRRTSIEMGSDDVSSPPSASSFLSLPSGRIGRILRRILPFRLIHFVRTSLYPRLSTACRPLTSGSLSGLPLLLYDSHVIWSTRALESMHDMDEEGPQPWCHFRFLVALTLTSLLLELAVDFALLRSAPRYSVLTGGSGFRPYVRGEGATTLTTDSHDLILDRIICTPVRLSSALLTVHKFNFPYVPLRVFPFLSTRWNPPLGGSYLWCLAFLAILGSKADKLNSYSGMIYGTTSGIFWSVGLTKFWGERYWGNWMLGVCFALICVGMRTEAQQATNGAEGRRRRGGGELVPCVDYVGWSFDRHREGRARERREGRRRMTAEENPASSPLGDDATTRREDGRDAEDLRPLLQRPNGVGVGVAIGAHLSGGSSGGGGGGDAHVIHGRVPLMSMDSELDGREGNDGGGGGGLSRRGGGGEGSSSSPPR